jgi:hypothetical protein
MKPVSVMRFQIVTVTSLRVLASWDVVTCSLLETDQRYIGAYCMPYCPDGGSKHLLNVTKLTPDYMAQHPRR